MTDPYSTKPATADFVLREGDSAPALETTLTDLDGSAVDLTNASVRLYVRREATDDDVVNTDVTGGVTNASGGELSVTFDSGFSTTGSGMHTLYFEVTFNSGAQETYPRGGVAYLWVPERFATGSLADLDPQNAEVGVLDVADRIELPTYATIGDVPTGMPEGSLVYVSDDGDLAWEDGT
mgnify:CR=1 FL=1